MYLQATFGLQMGVGWADFVKGLWKIWGIRKKIWILHKFSKVKHLFFLFYFYSVLSCSWDHSLPNNKRKSHLKLNLCKQTRPLEAKLQAYYLKHSYVVTGVKLQVSCLLCGERMYSFMYYTNQILLVPVISVYFQLVITAGIGSQYCLALNLVETTSL